ncbi:DNA-binding protein [Xanthobacter sp. DSM 24535]|uniref:DNA-binding protein n=1 Tax=Roseixanthobacter psychrophilus TaxID=3119917 RepID=UPI00372BBCDD
MTDAAYRGQPTKSPALAGDVLMGAHAIAEFLDVPASKVYYLVAIQRIPFFRLGSMLCARKSVLLDWIKAQEQKNSRV